jgi:hypothetical protein
VGGCVPEVRVTVRVSVPAFVTASTALMVKTFGPDNSAILLHVQAVVPAQFAVPPRSFVHMTEVTPTLSEADPISVIGLELVSNVGFGVGDVIVTVGGVLSNVTVRTSWPIFPAASEALTVNTLAPANRLMLLQVQFVVPVQVAPAVRSLVHVTCATPTLSEAEPVSVIGVVLVANVAFVVGVRIVSVGAIVSAA